MNRKEQEVKLGNEAGIKAPKDTIRYIRTKAAKVKKAGFWKSLFKKEK